MAPRHRWIHVVLIVLVVALQIATMGIQFWATNRFNIAKEWFGEKGRDDSRSRDRDRDMMPPRQPLNPMDRDGGKQSKREHYFDIPHGPRKWYMDMMYILLFIYQLAWQAYGLSTIARTTPDYTSYLYSKPYYMPVAMYISYMVSMILRIAWSVMLPRCTGICVGLLAGSLVASAVAMDISQIALYRSGAELYQLGLSLEIWLVRGLVHNGLAAFATYEFSSVIISLMGVMTHDGYSYRDSAITMLGVALLLLIIYALIDLFFFEKYFRYTISPYVVLLLGLIAMLEDHWYSGAPSVMEVLGLVFCLILIVIKIVNILGRQKQNREPIDINKTSVQPVIGPTNTTMMPLRMTTLPQIPMSNTQIPRNNSFQFNYM